MKKKYILYLVLLAVIVLVSYFLFRKREVVLNVSQRQDGGVDFLFDYKNVNGLLHMQIWGKESRAILWDVNLNYYAGDKLKYGEVPSEFLTFNGVENYARQRYPLNNKAPEAIPLDKEIYIRLEYQYDEFISPCVASLCYVVKIKPKLSVEKIDGIPAERYLEPEKEKD